MKFGLKFSIIKFFSNYNHVICVLERKKKEENHQNPRVNNPNKELYEERIEGGGGEGCPDLIWFDLCRGFFFSSWKEEQKWDFITFTRF